MQRCVQPKNERVVWGIVERLKSAAKAKERRASRTNTRKLRMMGPEGVTAKRQRGPEGGGTTNMRRCGKGAIGLVVCVPVPEGVTASPHVAEATLVVNGAKRT